MLYRMLIPVLLGINACFGALFFTLRWIALRGNIELLDFETVGVAAYFTALVIGSLWSLKKSERFQSAMLLWNTSHFFMVGILLLLEVFFSTFPQTLPQAIINTNPSLLYSHHKKAQMIEYLEDSPWVKFRPNTTIRSHGARGEDFVNLWQTDELGFKNIPDLARQERVVAIAAGDSFVEAMGLPVELMWTTLLTRRGFPVYNLGVQGYAPIQIKGSLERFGGRFKTDIVFFGYTPGFETRELNYVNKTKALEGKVFTGGIGIINDYMHEERARYKFFKVINSTIHFSKQALKEQVSDLFDRLIKRRQQAQSRFLPYRGVVLTGAKIPFDAEALQFRLTQEAILRAKQTASERGRAMAIIFFPSKAFVYHQKVLGQPAPPSHYENQVAEAIKSLCQQNDIDFLDLRSTFLNYVNGLPDQGKDLSDLPYFEVDGHMNTLGNKLVAQEILPYLKKSASSTN
ncbi:MAG: hypothetical protein HY592_01185 [Candidatus Omnitrophica bacterium]|nr:hypothetical protein [Candidatus Omnitrophota bacterium]